MKLIQFQGDAFVATDVSAVMVVADEVHVLLRGGEDCWEYDYDSEEAAQAAASQAVQVLMGL